MREYASSLMNFFSLFSRFIGCNSYHLIPNATHATIPILAVEIPSTGARPHTVPLMPHLHVRILNSASLIVLGKTVEYRNRRTKKAVALFFFLKLIEYSSLIINPHTTGTDLHIIHFWRALCSLRFGALLFTAPSKIGLAVMVAYFENNQPGANKSYKVLKNL